MKLFKRKIKPNDFLEEDLPSSRPELFWDIMKNEFRKLFFVAGVLIVFALPFLAMHVFLDYELIAMESQGASSNWPHYVFLIANPFLAAIFGIGIAGSLRIIKRLCYMDPVFLWDDFKKGVKQNARQCVLFSFLIGIFFSICYLFRVNNPSSFVSNIPLGIFALIVFPCLMFAYPVIGTYTTKISETFSLSCRLYPKAFLTNLIPLVAFLSVYFFELIPDLVLKYALILLFLLLISPLMLLGFFLYSSYLFDKFINKEKYPELVGRGIRRKKEKEED